MQALFTLTPSESKRLIAKAVTSMPEVIKAKKEGYLIVARGSTSAYIAEELIGETLEKEKYVAGQIIRGVLCALHAGIRSQPIAFHKGAVLTVDPGTLIDKLGPHDIVIKGGNAVDYQGKVGVLMASPVGGTMGQFYMAMKAQGIRTIYAIGLEKLIPSVEKAAKAGGRLKLERTIGAHVGLACVADGEAFTEINALCSLFSVGAVHYASGGFGGAEGSVTIIVEGEPGEVNKCLDFIETIKGEPPLSALKGPCKTCGTLCSFQGMEEDVLPPYLR
ncbi:MAG: hypothetical protein JXB42_03130 [Deltaproteobacteria bacterium]|nr:hypothetical protein [Deltaproteobacteria bacterium]